VFEGSLEVSGYSSRNVRDVDYDNRCEYLIVIILRVFGLRNCSIQDEIMHRESIS
jgi:hypothetical protein